MLVERFYGILCLVVSMGSKIVVFLIIVINLFLLSSCKTVDDKSQRAIKKENEKLSKFLQQPESELKIVMGLPDKVIYDEKGSKIFVYISKKYNITCERKFEINKNEMVTGFSSKGCFWKAILRGGITAASIYGMII